MLDKSIPYKNIIMKLDCKLISSLSDPVLPNGYTFRLYNDGDEINWARIETSVLEFESENDAYDYFTKIFIPRIDELKSRCVFVLNQDGLPIATTTAWYDDSDLGHQVHLDWVAVCPKYQGMGIGEAIVKKALQIYNELEPHEDILLHTQTWSHNAVNLYHKLGFVMMKTETIKCCGNDYLEAVKVLEDVVLPETYLSLINTAK
jgi:ribosomal protein S18 acetylase RimI-like enzyme